MVSSIYTGSRANIHVENIYGVNNHHIIESCFKGLAIALRKALYITSSNTIPSTKGKILNDGKNEYSYN